MERGDRITHKGREGRILFSFPSGTPEARFPWAKIVLVGNIFTCVPLVELWPANESSEEEAAAFAATENETGLPLESVW